MPGNASEVVVRRQQQQFMANAELRKQSIDRADLHTLPPTSITKRRCRDVIFALGHQERKCGESVDNLLLRFGPGKPLKQLLEDQPGSDYSFTCLEGPQQNPNNCSVRRQISSQRQGPYACVYEQSQRRDRSFL